MKIHLILSIFAIAMSTLMTIFVSWVAFTFRSLVKNIVYNSLDPLYEKFKNYHDKEIVDSKLDALEKLNNNMIKNIKEDINDIKESLKEISRSINGYFNARPK